MRFNIQKVDKILKEVCQIKRVLRDLRDQNSLLTRELKFKRRPIGRIFKNRKASILCVSLLNKGYTYKTIADELNKKVKNFKTSRSAIGRFRATYIKALYK